MLALVHPANDVSHRSTPSSTSTTTVSSVTTPAIQRPPPATTSRKPVTSTAIPLAPPPPQSQSQPPPPPPAFHRHQTAPSAPHHPPPPRQSSSSSLSQPLSHPQQTAHHPHRSHTPRPATPTLTPASASTSSDASSPTTSVDIHTYPTTDLLKLLASLLTQIASTNDQLASSTNSSITTTSSTAPIHLNEDTPIWRFLTTASRSAISTPASTLTFHARNIPTITLEAYFLRILKYCPTTNEVFLALLVYFDRMSKLSADATGRTFVIDSYNIHRLVIAGVTVASKFFSDVFYTNSRYAKVGGLPLPELNQLELQFLLLNDFRLVISSDEMQRYAEQLVLFSRSSGLSGVDGSGAAIGAAGSSPVSGGASVTKGNGVAAPMSAMGAIDAYGGKVADEEYRARRPSSAVTTASSSSGDADALRSHQHQGSAEVDTDTETGAETETETEVGTEDDEASSTTGTTDDEPTIRAASIAERARRRESIDEVMRDGDRTPERRRANGSGDCNGDESMASP